jgi:hypothetical protein
VTEQSKEGRKLFAAARREIIDHPLKKYGFAPYNTSVLARLTDDNVFQFIDFQKYRYGGQFTVAIAIRPLYCPNDDHLTLLPGNRLYSMATKGKADKWWPDSNLKETTASLRETYKLITRFALPFFEATASSGGIIRSYEGNIFGISRFRKRVYWGTPGWGNFDFGHIYLRNGNIGKARKHFRKCIREFDSDDRDWAQSTAKKCVEVMSIMDRGPQSIEHYLAATTADSMKKLKIKGNSMQRSEARW